MIYESLYTITLVCLAMALAFSWKKIANLKEENRNLKIDHQEAKDTSDWYKARYQYYAEKIHRELN